MSYTFKDAATDLLDTMAEADTADMSQGQLADLALHWQERAKDILSGWPNVDLR